MAVKFGRVAIWVALVTCLTGGFAAAADAEPLALNLRKRTETAPDAGRYHAVTTPTKWDSKKTAIVVCDMWDTHTCPNAALRVSQMAPRMNELLKVARNKGVFIIHCPSDTMNFYKDHPGRKLAQAAPKAEPKRPLERWCKIDPMSEAALPIDDTDGGCDCERTWKPGDPYPWTRQIATLEIMDGDAITDSAEAYYLMRQRGIENVIVMGVHTNMCVLGRPFSIRQMVYQGLNVALVRDLTDTMYNPAMKPFVSHFTGTDLVVEHIEKYWCPTFTSGDLLDGKEYRFPADTRPHVVMLLGEEEYQTARTLPKFAAEQLGKDYRVTSVFLNETSKASFPGIEAVQSADVLLISARRRPLPKRELDMIRAYVAAGKPVLGIRTASHAFHLRNAPPPEGLTDWPDIDAIVFGGSYTNHYGHQLKSTVSILPMAKDNPLVKGIPMEPFPGGGGLYQTSPLKPGAVPVLTGMVEGVDKPEPVAWTFTRADGGKSFYTSLGHPDDFERLELIALLKNALSYLSGGRQPPESTTASRTSSDRSSTPIADANNTNTATQASPETTKSNVTTTSNQGVDTPRSGWKSLRVPGTWNELDPALKNYDGFAWYRSQVSLPVEWKKRSLYLYVENVDNACETFFNGVKIGVSGKLPPNYESGLLSNQHRYVVPPELVKTDGPNLVAIRVYDHDGNAGFKGIAPALLGGNEAISLAGDWQFRTGDDVNWATAAADAELLAKATTFSTVGPSPKLSPFATVIRRQVQDKPLSTQQSRDLFKVPDDLEVDLVLSEPLISQPVFMNFDRRGRLWVMNYLQYPEPAGLKLLSKDQWWRAVYDKVPLPPPLGDKGADKITIHEDTDGDGKYDTHKTFVDGLNIAVAFAQSNDGVYVLNPPYLLFYPDQNQDDVPDAAPTVLLEGFGIEDTHSVVNSLCWGPDGWLYAAQGSTVTGNVKRPGEKVGVVSLGQNIWRYHPATKRYEIFSEGGGNAFGVEFDSAGRLFSGHNGGNTRGFHYMQGAYLQKGFGKHGPLSNPYTFGYFPAMEHGNYARFTHNFVVYEQEALPEAYRGKIFAINPITSHVVISERIPVGSTFKTKDVAFAIDSADTWFRPVDIKEGPDGNIYVADWYDGQLAHTANYQGGIDKEHGRIWRIRAKSPPKTSITAHASNASIPSIQGTYVPRSPDASLEELWATYRAGKFTPDLRKSALKSADPHVREWTVRLIADDRQLPADLVAPILSLSQTETDLDVLCQLACSAQRLPATQGLPLTRHLMHHSEFAEDSRYPLLVWWALETQVGPARSLVLELFDDAKLWSEPLVEKEILPRLMRRFAATGQRGDLAVCAQLLKQSPTKESTAALMRGFEEAYQGRSLANVPEDLVKALSAAGGGSLSLRIRQGDAAAVEEALKALADEKASSSKRVEYAVLFGEVKTPTAVPVMLNVMAKTTDDNVRTAILASLPSYDDETIAMAVLAQYSEFTDDVRGAAQSLLASRKSWTSLFLAAIDRDEIHAVSVPIETVRKLTIHRDPAIAILIKKHWGDVEGASTVEMQTEAERLTRLLIGGTGGDPYPGKELYLQNCGKCHKLHLSGGSIGPDLTSFKRDDIPRLLVNILNPSAEIREGFETHVAVLDDGRVVQGFLVEQDPQVLVLRTTEGQSVSINRNEIDEHQVTKKSLMPEGLLKNLSDEQIRNLFAYLRVTQPLND